MQLRRPRTWTPSSPTWKRSNDFPYFSTFTHRLTDGERTHHNGEKEYEFPTPERIGEERGTLTRHIQEAVFTVDHKKLGIMYIASGLIFFVIAGIMATLMRIQLIIPNNHFLDPDVFNRFFTMHGTAMVFLVGMPLIFGFANYLVPLMIGSARHGVSATECVWVLGVSSSAVSSSSRATSPLRASTMPAPRRTSAGSRTSPLTAKAFSRGHSTDYWTLLHCY